MITDYLINNRLYLKEKIRIQCAVNNNSSDYWSTEHQWVELENFIELVLPTKFDDMCFIYKKDDKVFIYWCDVNIFTELHCLTIKEVRNNKLNEVLD